MLVDSFGYLMQAHNMEAYGTWYAEDWLKPLLPDYFSIRPPFYAWLINQLGSIFPLLLLQNTLSVLSLWWAYQTAKKLGVSSRQLNRWSWIALFLVPAQLIHAQLVMTEMVFQFMLFALFVCWVRWMVQPGFGYALSISVLLGLAMLTKPVALLLPVFVGISMLVKMYQLKQLLPHIGLLILPILVFHVVCKQNEHATGYYHFSSIQHINQLKYNARYALADAKGEAYADSVVALVVERASHQTAYGNRLAVMDSAAMHIIQSHPMSFAKVYAKGVAAFWLDPGRFDAYRFLNIEDHSVGLLHEVQVNGYRAILAYLKVMPLWLLLLLLGAFCWNIIQLFALVKSGVTRNGNTALKWVGFILLLYVTAATGPVGVSRYRVPLIPIVWVLISLPYSHNHEESI